MRNVFIETDSAGQILNANLYAAFDGFTKKGYDVSTFYLDCPAQTKEDIVCGTVATVHRAWRKMGIALPEILDYPPQLSVYLGRSTWETTLGAVRQIIFAGAAKAIFVKPRLVHKLFTGQVMQHPRHLISTTALPDKTAVWLSETVAFVSEYRLFVLHGLLLGAKHYTGDFCILPDFKVAEAAIAAFTDAPVAYSLDFGITADGRTLLVEANDGFALGNYGWDSFLYAKFIEARWDEVTTVLSTPICGSA